MRGLMWFKEDLRVRDNTALYHASRHCKDGVIAVYILDISMWKKHDMAPVRIDFMLRGLKELQDSLAKLNIPFIIIKVKTTHAVKQEILAFAKKVNAECLFYNKQYEVNELARDLAVEKLLEKNHIDVLSFHDQTIIAPGVVRTGQGKFFSVFTPFKRAWIKIFLEKGCNVLPAPKRQQALHLNVKSAPLPTSDSNTRVDPKLWPAGEEAARKRLSSFISRYLSDYDKQRDFPALDATSKISPYLAAGMISARQCFMSALEHNHNEIDSGSKGVTTWLGELIWRDFYKNVLVAAPRVSKHRAYQIETDKIKWPANDKLLKAWQQGKTGYPLIDAAMRQLNTIGWMHNRLRMVVAMFLTKNLFLDWRQGEEYFIKNLIDGDLSSNNGGWQWSASTGTDAAPYFRIFNPIRQSMRFDPEGKFILQYCPELKGFDKKSIHEPYQSLPDKAHKAGYPKPIIDLNQNRDKVMQAYRQVHKK